MFSKGIRKPLNRSFQIQMKNIKRQYKENREQVYQMKRLKMNFEIIDILRKFLYKYFDS